jgi:REP element-mobilizing transposase RayT
MSRPLRVLAPDALYHVTARGNAKAEIYSDDDDRHRFLTLLENVVDRYGVECHAYCLMSNHYHLVIGTPEANLSRAIQYLNGRYAQWWNTRHGRVGHLLHGPFKAQLIQDDRYFLEACRYVVLNPVRAGMVNDARDWIWSSYAATAGLVPCPRFLTIRWVLGTPSTETRREYRAFIGAGAPDSEVTAALDGDLPIIGSDAFAAAYREEVEQAHQTEVVWRHRTLGRPSLEELFAGASDRSARNLSIQKARERHHYRISEIARHLSLHYGTVSRIASAMEAGKQLSAVPSQE